MALTSLKNVITCAVKNGVHNTSLLKYSTMGSTGYKTLTVSKPKEFVNVVTMNRANKLNAMNNTMWLEFKECFDELAVDPDCRVIVLAGSGRTFCAGIDFMDVLHHGQEVAEQEDIARKCKLIKQRLEKYQDSFTAIEKCPKPVIAAVHGACIGAGIDMISAADMRYCSNDAWFQIKEVGIGMAADVGTLQRFPKVVGSDSLTRELVYTARKFDAKEALQCGFVSRIFDNQESLLAKSIEMADEIAKKSPVAVQGSKTSLVYSRDHSVQDGLAHIAAQNQAMLQSEDFMNATMSEANKAEPPVFSKL